MVFAKWEEMNKCSGDVVAVREVFGKMVTIKQCIEEIKIVGQTSDKLSWFLGIMSGSLLDCKVWKELSTCGDR